jgi:hypothetical protein
MQSEALAAGLTRLDLLDAAWAVSGHGPRLRAVRRGAEILRERFASGPRALAVRTAPLTSVAYPTKYAFWSAAYTPVPYVNMIHRCLVVQFLQHGEPKLLLFNPSDPVANRATPYFARLIEQFGERAAGALQTLFPRLEDQLAAHGFAPEDVDYVAFDHFHTQDLRPLLGTVDGRHAARFPNATLLAPRAEWDDLDELHPFQKAWFVPGMKDGVRTERVLLTDGDLELGDGVLVARTPGHTSGNQTLFVNTSSGVWGCSENGTCADNWTPQESRIPGLAALCKKQDLEIVINANTPELGAQQYTSMTLEKTLVDRVARAPGFVQMFASSEVTPSWKAPGIKPTILFGEILHGNFVEAPRLARAAE